MNDKTQMIKISEIQNQIYTIRGVQVMVDKDLANMYSVETKNLNKAVKRNINRFPDKFRFQLTEEEYKVLKLQIEVSSEDSLRFQFGTSKNQRGGRRYLPFVFTEQGVSMLSAILHSDIAVVVSIQIMDAFVKMRKQIASNGLIYHRLDKLEHIQLESNQKFEQIFKALESKDISPKNGIFYNGQIFDAHSFVSDLIRSAEKSILLIDNYIDDTVLTLLTKRKKNVTAIIYTKKISKKNSLRGTPHW